MSKLQLLKGALYSGVSALSPIVTFLGSDEPITGRKIAAVIGAGLIAGGFALKAFLSDPKAKAN